MTEQSMRKSLRISIYLIFLMLAIVCVYMFPKIQFLVKLFEVYTSYKGN